MKIPVFKKSDFSIAASARAGLYDPKKAEPLLAPIWEREIAKQFPSEMAKLSRYEKKPHLFMFIGIGDPFRSLTEIWQAISYCCKVPMSNGGYTEFWWTPNVEGFIRLPAMTFVEKSVADALTEAWAEGQTITESMFVPKTFDSLESAIRAYICPNWEIDFNVNQGQSLGLTNKGKWKIADSGIRIAFRSPEKCWEFVQENASYSAESMVEQINSAALKFKWQPRGADFKK